MTRKRKRRVPDLQPAEGFAWLAKQQRRVATKNGNHATSGYVDEDQLHLEELSAAARAKVTADHEVWLTIPLAEKATEYVIRKDESGQYAGLQRRS